MSCDYPGYMTNSLIKLSKKAQTAGFKELVAFTKPRNDKSKRLLLRVGFQYVGKGNKKLDLEMDKFVLKL